MTIYPIWISVIETYILKVTNY